MFLFGLFNGLEYGKCVGILVGVFVVVVGLFNGLEYGEYVGILFGVFIVFVGLFNGLEYSYIFLVFLLLLLDYLMD